MNRAIVADNGLTMSATERLTILIEEASEVIKAASKVLRHGWNPIIDDKVYHNRKDLEEELGDLRHAIMWMCQMDDVTKINIHTRAVHKAKWIIPFLRANQIGWQPDESQSEQPFATLEAENRSLTATIDSLKAANANWAWREDEHRKKISECNALRGELQTLRRKIHDALVET